MQALLGTLSLSSVSVCRMTTLRERLELAMDGNSPRTTQAAIAKACGISTAAVAGWFQKENFALQATHCFALAKLMRVDAEWLATGRNAMHPKSPALAEHHASLLQDYRKLDQEDQTAVRTVIVSLARLKDPAYLAWQHRMEEHNRKRDQKTAPAKGRST